MLTRTQVDIVRAFSSVELRCRELVIVDVETDVAVVLLSGSVSVCNTWRPRVCSIVSHVAVNYRKTLALTANSRSSPAIQQLFLTDRPLRRIRPFISAIFKKVTAVSVDH